MIVGRIDGDSSRWYVDPLDEELRYESVTTILSAAESLPWMANWSAKMAAEYVAANIDELWNTYVGPGGPGAVIDQVKVQARVRRELKADIGTHQHNVLEALLLDQPLPDIPEHLVDVEIEGERVDHDAISDGLLNFLTDFDVTPVLAEATVASVIHGYAGTLDLIADFGRPPLPGVSRLLVDCKTGILKTHARAQLAAYRRADEVWVDRLGNKTPLPLVDGAAVLHLRREHRGGYKLVPGFTSTAQEQAAFDWFLACQRVLRHQAAQEKIPRGAWYPPRPDGTQPAPFIEDIEHPGLRTCRKPLITNGIESLEDLAHFTSAEVLALKGFGPKSLAACRELLAAHQLTFTDERTA